jgi:signal peptidase I
MPDITNNNIDTDNTELEEITEAQVQDNADKGEEQPSVTKEIVSWIQTFVVAILIAIFITKVLIVNAKVPSASMETTIMTNDRLIANRLAYITSDPERFDIVVFKFPDDESKLYIKRIIGLPGDKVEIRDGEVYINDSTEPLDDSFLHEPMYSQNAVYNVPEGCYFMLGDNRNNSADSRMWNNKFVAKDKILGKAVFRYWPLNNIGPVGNDSTDK